MSTLVEIGELARTRPALDATAEELAAWYERKARMLQRECLEEFADQAHEHAVRLLAAGGVA